MRRFTPSGSRLTSTPPTMRRAAGRAEQAAQHADGRGLAGAVGAEKAEDFACLTENDRSSTATNVAELARQAADVDGKVASWLLVPARAASRASASRTLASARVRASSLSSSATCATSTSVLVATPAANRSRDHPPRLGGAAHGVTGGPHHGLRSSRGRACRWRTSAATRSSRTRRSARASRVDRGRGFGHLRLGAAAVEERPVDVDADSPTTPATRPGAERCADSGWRSRRRRASATVGLFAGRRPPAGALRRPPMPKRQRLVVRAAAPAPASTSIRSLAASGAGVAPRLLTSWRHPASRRARSTVSGDRRRSAGADRSAWTRGGCCASISCARSRDRCASRLDTSFGGISPTSKRLPAHRSPARRPARPIPRARGRPRARSRPPSRRARSRAAGRRGRSRCRRRPPALRPSPRARARRSRPEV